MKQSFVILPLISVLFLTFASCKQNYCRFNGKIWATSYHIAYRGDSRFSDSIQSELLAIDGDLSLFNPLSEVSAVNDGTSDSIGQRFADVFEISHKVWQLSGGVYDPTIGPLAEIWGFGRSQGTSATDEAIAEALDAVGLGQCYIYGNKIVKKSPATRFDFSSVAKGYGIDHIADMFDRNGITDYMIEIGGEVSARGVNPSGRPWNIQIDSPEGGMAHKTPYRRSPRPGANGAGIVGQLSQCTSRQPRTYLRPHTFAGHRPSGSKQCSSSHSKNS